MNKKDAVLDLFHKVGTICVEFSKKENELVNGATKYIETTDCDEVHECSTFTVKFCEPFHF